MITRKFVPEEKFAEPICTATPTMVVVPFTISTSFPKPQVKKPKIFRIPKEVVILKFVTMSRQERR